MLTHLTRRRAAAAITCLAVISAACIQIAFRVTLRTSYLHMRAYATNRCTRIATYTLTVTLTTCLQIVSGSTCIRRAAAVITTYRR